MKMIINILYMNLGILIGPLINAMVYSSFILLIFNGINSIHVGPEGSVLAQILKRSTKSKRLVTKCNMSDTTDLCKVWTRFDAKKQDGSIIKLRVQSWPLQPGDDVCEFMIKHFVPDEAIHKAAGIARSQEALKEYRELMNIFFKAVPLHATVCCLDNNSNTVGKILGTSIVQLMKHTDKLEHVTKHMKFKTAEMQKLLHAAKILEGYLKEMGGYETFYFGRGIIVHPDYRRLGIANELIKVRKLICIDNNIPMTCAGMSARGTQKAADKNNWKTFSEIPIGELEEKTGLIMEKNIISHKLMYTTIH